MSMMRKVMIGLLAGLVLAWPLAQAAERALDKEVTVDATRNAGINATWDESGLRRFSECQMLVSLGLSSSNNTM